MLVAGQYTHNCHYVVCGWVLLRGNSSRRQSMEALYIRIMEIDSLRNILFDQIACCQQFVMCSVISIVTR
jgi:hypothetical protein